MKKFFNKLAKTFIGIGTSVVLFCKKMYALAPNTITPLYGPVEPEPEYGIKYKVINGIFLIFTLFVCCKDSNICEISISFLLYSNYFCFKVIQIFIFNI